jgi:hypothetical protein
MNMNTVWSRLRGCLVLAALWAASSGEASAQFLWGLTENQTLVRFSASAPGTLIATLPITGLVDSGEHIVGIEVEYEYGRLVGVSSAGRVYTLDRRTGAATLLMRPGPLLAPQGTTFGIVEWAQGLTLLANTSGVFLQRGFNLPTPFTVYSPAAALSPASPYAAVAWTYVPEPRYYAVDAAADTLVRYGVFEPETLVGSLNVDTSGIAGLDAVMFDGTLFAALTVGGAPGLYTIDRTTGHATFVAGLTTPIVSLAVDGQSIPEVIETTQNYVETNPQRTYLIRRRGDDTVPADLSVTLMEGTTNPVGGATPNVDFVGASDVLHFAPGETERQYTVTIIDDAIREPQEVFRVVVNAHIPGGFFGGLLGIFNATITDNDNQAPILSVTQPSTSSIHVLTPTITLSGIVVDEDAPKVSLFKAFDYLPIATVTGSPWTFPSVVLNPGFNSFTIQAEDPYFVSDFKRVSVWRSTEVDQTFTFAEGATGGFFTTELAFMNPHAVDVPVTIDFMREDGVAIPHAMTLPAERRVTLDISTVPGLEATATSAVVRTSSYPIAVERTMRWGEQGYGAHTEKGTAGASLKWHFAEGAQGFMHTYLLLVNPQSEPNDVAVRFLREGDSPVTKTFRIAPHARLTVDAGSHEELVNTAFGIEVTFTLPGVAERSMYFGLDPLWKGGHESAGVTAPAKEWMLAEGATGPFFETFVLVANPSSAPAELKMTYFTTGAPVVRTRTLPGNSRLSVNIEYEDPTLENAAVATKVESTEPVVVERAQYWPYSPDRWYEGHASAGVTETSTHWGLAEGRVGGPEAWQTYILVANTNEFGDANVTMRFLRENGPPVTRQFLVKANSRVNIAVGSEQVPEITSGSFSVDITSDWQPIVVERAMYSDVNGQVWGAGTNATATKLP